jgi:ATP-binding cassette subfamily B (MDR/TAP) protein 1
MEKSKSVATPLYSHFNLNSNQSPTSEIEKDEMKKVSYSSTVRNLMYAMVCTQADITHAVGVVSGFLANPGNGHWNDVKWILRCLRGTSKMSLCFGSRKLELIGYIDANMAADIDSRKSTFEITIFRGAVS